MRKSDVLRNKEMTVCLECKGLQGKEIRKDAGEVGRLQAMCNLEVKLKYLNFILRATGSDQDFRQVPISPFRI